CKFCQTGRMGLKRNLGVEEITGQLYNARHHLGKKIKNIVFMGMGEPFDNFETVVQAVAVMKEQRGFDIAPRHITISTCGLVTGIEALAQMDLPGLRLAVSINAPDNGVRSQIMPVNQAFPLEKLKSALDRFPLGPRGTFMFEYILIKDLNDSRAQAEALADFIHPLPVRLNLIPFNPVGGFDHQSPDDDALNEFAEILTQRGIFVIKRWSKGRSVSAGCGQLGKKR
ncbi:MAG: radical SAM protein, partial [Desulfovibrionales bacterium]|nr:radical SAM protein [Desulfovibrionales bacterium]